jgi:hypothetical protein
MGLNMAPPNMSHIGPIIMMADTMTVTVSANSPMPLMDASASAACRKWEGLQEVCRGQVVEEWCGGVYGQVVVTYLQFGVLQSFILT